jgi:hypothetical protein
MSQIGPYLSQMGPKNTDRGSPDWPLPYPPDITAILKGTDMSRSKTCGLALALIASAALSTACTKIDATGPSDHPQVSFQEGQGAVNGK